MSAFWLVLATIRKSWVILGKPINITYSDIDEPWVTPRWSISTPQGDLPTLAYPVAGLSVNIKIYFISLIQVNCQWFVGALLTKSGTFSASGDLII